MNSKPYALTEIDNLPINCESVQKGKVRTVYWLTEEDSMRISEEKGYNVANGTKLGIMVISDRISAFDKNWRGETLEGVPNKGMDLNAISEYLFDEMRYGGIPNHILDKPHKNVWIVQKAEPAIKIEVIVREYIDGSMWNAYKDGQREFWGYKALPENLKKGDKLPEIMVTPTTKGTIMGVAGIPEKEDAKITKETIIKNYKTFNLRTPEDWMECEDIAVYMFRNISRIYAEKGFKLKDCKFELGYYMGEDGYYHIFVIDEPPTLDSARLEDETGKDISKEYLRTGVIDIHGSQENAVQSESNILPDELLLETGRNYDNATERIIGHAIDGESSIDSIIECLMPYGVITGTEEVF